VFGIQFPAPSLTYPVGHTLGKGDESGTQFPFPSLCYPSAQKSGIDEATQFPYPSLLNPEGQEKDVIGTDADNGKQPP
jgi:hypothetical protein